jgi:hypothetical protein
MPFGLSRTFDERGEAFMNGLVAGIFYRFYCMEDTHATRSVMSRSCYVADYCDGTEAGSNRDIAGTEAPRRLLSRACHPKPSGP